MQLQEYRELRKLTRRETAEQLAVTENTVYRWEVGKQMPRPGDLKKIKAWSAGAVTANDFAEAMEGKD